MKIRGGSQEQRAQEDQILQGVVDRMSSEDQSKRLQFEFDRYGLNSSAASGDKLEVKVRDLTEVRAHLEVSVKPVDSERWTVIKVKGARCREMRTGLKEQLEAQRLESLRLVAEALGIKAEPSERDTAVIREIMTRLGEGKLEPKDDQSNEFIGDGVVVDLGAWRKLKVRLESQHDYLWTDVPTSSQQEKAIRTLLKEDVEGRQRANLASALNDL